MRIRGAKRRELTHDLHITVITMKGMIINMNFDKKNYAKLSDKRAGKSPILKNCINAFWTGGLICTMAEALRHIYTGFFEMADSDAGTLVSITLVFVAVLFTGLGWFPKIAKLAGAGTLVPITGFANAVASPAIDSRAEGLVLGVGAKIFTVAGPVLLYGTLAGAVYGLIYYFLTLG